MSSEDSASFIKDFLHMELDLFNELSYTDIPSVVDEAYSALSVNSVPFTSKAILLARTRQIYNQLQGAQKWKNGDALFSGGKAGTAGTRGRPSSRPYNTPAWMQVKNITQF
jgi:hypothetical protein